MKKCVSIMLLLAMLLSMAMVGTVGASAAKADVTNNGGRKAVYTTLKPTIDGVKDPIYDTTTPVTLGLVDNPYIKLYVLWNEDGLYIFGVSTFFNFLDFYISGLACSMPNLEWNWDGGGVEGRYPGNYSFRCKDDGTLLQATYGYYGIVTPEGMLYKTVKEKENGFCMELFVPMAENCWSIKSETPGIGFGFMVNADWNRVNGWTAGTALPAPYNMQTILLEKTNPGLPQTQDKTISLHGVQTNAATDGKFDARFVAEIDSLEYDKAGFELSFTYNGTEYTKNLDTTTAYTSLLAGGETVKPTKTGNYLVALVLEGIPEDANLEITVKPYTVSGETTTYGTTGSFTLNPISSAEN